MTQFLPKPTLKSLILLPFFLISLKSNSQCTRVSTCGYTVVVNVEALSIIASSTSCPFGYNYNVRFRYSITASGTNTCSSGTLGVQPQIFCNSRQNNGYYTINTVIPNGAVSVTNSGTLTTTTNPYRSATDCATATPTSLGCNAMQVTMFGPGISTITFTCNFSILPIELADFYAYQLDNAIKFNWTTLSEKNNDFFTLEKSQDAETWTIVKNLKGAGNSSQKISYHTFDENYTTGTHYYRLKQTDYDGTHKYSDIIWVDLEDKGQTLVVNLFPNPFNNELHIETNSEHKKNIRLTSSSGQVILNNSFHEKISLELSRFPYGIYFLEVTDGNHQNHQKIFKQ